MSSLKRSSAFRIAKDCDRGDIASPALRKALFSTFFVSVPFDTEDFIVITFRHEFPGVAPPSRADRAEWRHRNGERTRVFNRKKGADPAIRALLRQSAGQALFFLSSSSSSTSWKSASMTSSSALSFASPSPVSPASAPSPSLRGLVHGFAELHRGLHQSVVRLLMTSISSPASASPEGFDRGGDTLALALADLFAIFRKRLLGRVDQGLAIVAASTSSRRFLSSLGMRFGIP